MLTKVVIAIFLIGCLTGCGKREPPTDTAAPTPPPPTSNARISSSPPPSDQPTSARVEPNRADAPPGEFSDTILRDYHSHWNNPDERARLIDAVAVQALETGNKAEAVRLFTEMLKVETSPELKMTLLDELATSEHPSALAPILERLSPNEPEEVRDAALAAAETLVSMLGFEKNKDAFEPILKLLDTRYPSSLRELAISTLEDLEDKRAIPYLQRLLHDPDENVRAAAQAAIEWLQQE